MLIKAIFINILTPDTRYLHSNTVKKEGRPEALPVFGKVFSFSQLPPKKERVKFYLTLIFLLFDHAE